MSRYRHYRRASSWRIKGIGILVVIAALIIGLPYLFKDPHPLSFSIYTTTSNLLPQYQAYYANATSGDVLIDDSYTPIFRDYLPSWSKPQIFPRMIIADSYDTITSSTPQGESNLALAKQYNFGPNDYFGYDAEHWSKTPQSEQGNNESAAVAKVYAAIHLAGYKCAWTPQLGGFSEGQWESVDFSNIDYGITRAGKERQCC